MTPISIADALTSSTHAHFLDVATEQIPNESVKYVADRYLESGEWMMDRTVEAMARYPEYFKRK
ncbi:hypothetical protein RI367_004686 [Sorochytrium milnesiophthora]